MRVLLIVCFLITQCHAQVSQFQKSVLDSVKVHKLYGLGSLTFSLNKDSKTNLFFINDAAFLYASEKHTYELLSSLNFNSSDKISNANRFYTMLRAGLWRNKWEQNKTRLKKQRIYAEPFLFFQWDENRGISQRWQYGLNAVYARRYDHKHIKWNLGAGLLYEKEDWRVLSRDDFPQFDTLPAPVKELIKDILKIDDKGHLQRDNFRLNLYGNLFAEIKSVNINLFLGLQQPLRTPFEGLPILAYYPYPKKKFPRITVDASISFKITRHASLITRYYFQTDKGQLSQFVPDQVYTLSQGISVKF
jgi:hypothetical protein